MIYIRNFSFVIFAAFFSFGIFSNSGNAEESLDILNGIKSASGNFEQIIREQDGYVVDRQTGTFAMDRPRRMRWQINELDQLLVSDGEQMFLYDELFKQVIVRDWSSNPVLNPAAILLEQVDLETWASVEQAGQNFRLIPLEKFGSVLELNLTVSDDFPEQLNILDATGQITEIRFSQVEINPESDDQLFQFVIPAGVEVLYE